MYIREEEDGSLSVCYDNQNGNVKYQIDSFSEVMQNNGKIILLKNKKLYTSSNQYIYHDYHSDNQIPYNVFCVEDPVSHKLGIMDLDGRILLPTEYDNITSSTYINSYKKRVSIVLKGGLYGLFIEEKGLIIPAKYEMIEPLQFDSGISYKTYDRFKPLQLYKVKEKNQYGLFHLDKGWVLPAMYDSIESTIISKDGKYGIFDHEGKIVITLIYDAVISQFRHVFESNQYLAKLRILNTVYTIDENNNVLEECEHYKFLNHNKYERNDYSLISDIESFNILW